MTAPSHYSSSAHNWICHCCSSLQSVAVQSCQFCGANCHHRRTKSLQRAWVFLLTGLMFYIPANTLPIMISSSLGRESPSTIVSGIHQLWLHGSYPIAVVIFIASVFVPLAKFVMLLGLLLTQQFDLFDYPNIKTLVYRLTEFVGRWSMVDVFVVAFLAGLIQFDEAMTIRPGPAVLAFAVMIIATMISALSIDSRVFWEGQNE